VRGASINPATGSNKDKAANEDRLDIATVIEHLSGERRGKEINRGYLKSY
jgi:hypothetical protein